MDLVGADDRFVDIPIPPQMVDEVKVVRIAAERINQPVKPDAFADADPQTFRAHAEAVGGIVHNHLRSGNGIFRRQCDRRFVVPDEDRGVAGAEIFDRRGIALPGKFCSAAGDLIVSDEVLPDHSQILTAFIGDRIADLNAAPLVGHDARYTVKLAVGNHLYLVGR